MSEREPSDLLKKYRDLISKVIRREIIAERISENGIIRETEEKTIINEEGLHVETSVNVRLADCLHRVRGIDEIGGKCYKCQSIVCVSCFRVCQECGKGICKKHQYITDKGEIYCRSCRWKVHFKRFMGFE